MGGWEREIGWLGMKDGWLGKRDVWLKKRNIWLGKSVGRWERNECIGKTDGYLGKRYGCLCLGTKDE